MASSLQTIEENYVLPQAFSLNFNPAQLSDEQFEELCRNHSDLKFEMSAEGELIIMPPTSLESGWRNSDLIIEIGNWARRDKTGIVFDSSTMFTLPGGAKRSPDVSWILRGRVEKLSLAERRKFARIVPDFVIELRSPSDALANLQRKMREYVESGARLGWLIDPENKTVHVYRQNRESEILENPEMISGEDVLIDFELNVRAIW